MRRSLPFLAISGLAVAALGFFAGRWVSESEDTTEPTLPAATLSKGGFRIPTLPAAESLPGLETTIAIVEVTNEADSDEEPASSETGGEVAREPEPEPEPAPEKKEPAPTPEPGPAPDVTVGTTE
jgi:hypothetical protein